MIWLHEIFKLKEEFFPHMVLGNVFFVHKLRRTNDLLSGSFQKGSELVSQKSGKIEIYAAVFPEITG